MGSGQSLLTKVPNVPVELIIDGLFLHFDGMSPELRSKLDARLEVETGIRDESASTFDYSTIVGKSKVD